MSERLRKVASPAARLVPPEAPTPAPEAVTAPLRVLVVDDDDVDRMIVRRALARAGMAVEVREADSAPAAIAQVAGGALDCVFLDYNIPGGDGLTLLRAIRGAALDVPVIMLTGHGDEQVAVELMKAGAADYVPKAALTPERIAQSLRYAVELARAAATTRAAQAELREAAGRTQYLAEASRLLAGSLDVDMTLRAIAQLGVPRLGEFCAIVLTGPRGTRSVAAAHADPASAELAHAFERWYRTALDHPASIVGEVMRSGRPGRFAQVADEHLAMLANDAAERRMLRALAPAAVLIVPLVARETVIGVLAFSRATSQPHEDMDVALAEDLAQRAALALDNARLFAAATEARHRAEDAAARLERLQRLTAALADAASEHEVGDLVMQHGVLSAGAYAGVIAEPTVDGDGVELRTCVGYPPEACMHVGRRWPTDARIPLAEAARTGEPVFVSSSEAWAARYTGGYTPSTPARATSPGTTPSGAGPQSRSGAWAALPLRHDGRRGAILWTFDAPRDFTEEDRAFMAAVAQQCAQALERARLREAERRARTEAEEANRAKSEFLARMSHELRTPLNAIGGYAQLIELGVHGPVTPAQAEALARVRRAQGHLLTLINDILSFAKLEAGQVSVTIEPVPVAPVIDELAALLRPEAATRGLALEVDAVPVALAVRADRARLIQVLLNLASNALKFTAAGTVRVVVRAASDMIEFAVSDTGRGVPHDQLEAIFAPFVQVRGPVDAQMGGVGLGLAISRELARGMGGTLTAESTLGVGSTFTLRLPSA